MQKLKMIFSILDFVFAWGPCDTSDCPYQNVSSVRCEISKCTRHAFDSQSDYFRDEDPDPVLFSTDPDPDPTCNNGFIKLFLS